MAILLRDEVNLKKIDVRFIKTYGKYHEVNLGCPDIGAEWTFENSIKIHPQDWKTITEKIKEDYKGINYDLILASAMLSDRVAERIAKCFTNCYKLK